LNNVFRLSPETGRIASQLTTLNTRADATAKSIENRSMTGVPKPLRHKYEVAYTAAQVEARRGYLESVVDFRKEFPTYPDYAEVTNSPGYKAFVERRAALHASEVEPWNIAGGGLSPEQRAAASQRGTNGEFSNMIALSADEAKARGFTPRPKAIAGPSVRRSPVAETFTGHAEAYEPSLVKQDARAIRLSGKSALESRVVDSAVKSGMFVPVEEGKRGPAGWGTISIPIAAGLDVSKPARVRDFYVHPDAHQEVRTLFGLDINADSGGLGSIASRGATQGVIFGTAEALGHGTRTLLPQAVLADRLYGGTVAKDTVKFLFSKEAMNQERIRQTEAGVSRPAYEYGGATKYLKPLSEPLVAFDLATRKTLMAKANRDYDAAVKAGKADEAGRYEYVRREGLRAGQYNALAMDTATKMIRAIPGQFAVAGKLNYANPYKTLVQLMTGSRSGLNAAAGTRVANVAKVASLMTAAFMYSGAQNKAKTGSFFPAGVPVGAVADDYDEERKAWTYHWPLLGRAAGAEGVMKKTPVGPAATGINRGEGVGRIALDVATNQAANIVRPILSSPIIRLQQDLDSGHVTGEKAYDRLKNSVPLLKFFDSMFHSNFGEAGEALSGEGRPGRVLSPRQLAGIR